MLIAILAISLGILLYFNKENEELKKQNEALTLELSQIKERANSLIDTLDSTADSKSTEPHIWNMKI